MRVLVECEFSGVVRRAFAALGHEAWSCDLLPSEDASDWHLQGDALEVAGLGAWDLMVCHPPCTYLANSGVRWLAGNPGRQASREEAVAFCLALFNLPIPRIAMENPVGHLSTAFRRPDQIIQPYHFGHLERKTTCLWLRGLPCLVPTCDVSGQALALPARERDRVHWMPPSAERWKARSRTYTGFAAAMASQWGCAE